MKKHYVLAGIILLAASQGFAQVKIRAAGAPDGSAMLEVTSGAAHNKGLLLPRLTDGERNAMTSPASGLLIFNTSANSVQVNIGTSLLPLWVTASATAAAWNTTGNAGSDPATNFIGTSDNQSLVVRTNNTGSIYFAPRVNGAFAALSGMTSAYLGDGTTNKSKLGFLTSNTVAMTIDSNSNVGIGAASPKVKLQVNGGILLRRDVNIAHGNGTYITWSTVRSGVGETEFINYRGTGSGGFRFYDVNPGGSVDTANYNPGGGASNNYIAFIAPGTGAYSSISDMRVKTDVNIIDGALEKVMAMRPVSYDFHTSRKLKDGVITYAKDDKPMKTIGFLAQELAKVVPEAVVVPKDPANELYTVSYTTVIPVFTKAIQEQQAEIEKLKAALAISKADNAALKADVSKISALAERMQQLEASLGTTANGKTTVSK